MLSILLYWALVAAAALGWALALTAFIAIAWRMHVRPEASVQLSPSMELPRLATGAKEIYVFCRAFSPILGGKGPMRRLLSHSLHLSLWVQDAGGRGVPVTKQRWPVQYHSFGWIYTQYGRFSANGGEAYRILPSELPPCGPEELLGITLLIYPARRITPYGLMGILALGVAIAQPATIIAATAF